jgi:hypothetical protein
MGKVKPEVTELAIPLVGGFLARTGHGSMVGVVGVNMFTEFRANLSHRVIDS